VISGMFYIGLREEFDERQLTAGEGPDQSCRPTQRIGDRSERRHVFLRAQPALRSRRDGRRRSAEVDAHTNFTSSVISAHKTFDVARINQKKVAATSAAFRPFTTLNGPAWKKAVERAQIRGKKVIPHGARHTFATWLLNAGISERALMALGNWKTLSMMRNYAHLKGDHLADAVALLPTPELAGKGALKLVMAGSPGGKRPRRGTKNPAGG
jgi:integrase